MKWTWTQSGYDEEHSDTLDRLEIVAVRLERVTDELRTKIKSFKDHDSCSED